MTGSSADVGLLRPRVSFAIPVRNGEQFIGRALDSLLDQDFADFEVVVCDNASTDSTPDIVQRYAERDPRVRYVRNAEIPPGEEEITQEGSGGWSVDVYRYITYPDGHQTTEEWTWHYTGLYQIIERHPCMFNNSCPDPEPEP